MSQQRQQVERLYRQHGPELLSYLRRRFARLGAEDLLQQTFIHAMSVEDWSQINSPRAWLFTVARRAALAQIRRQKPAAALSEDIAETRSVIDPRLDEMRQRIECLPETLREPLELRLTQELSYEEIASVLELPLGTVKSRLHSAVATLRAALAPAE